MEFVSHGTAARALAAVACLVVSSACADRTIRRVEVASPTRVVPDTDRSKSPEAPAGPTRGGAEARAGGAEGAPMTEAARAPEGPGEQATSTYPAAAGASAGVPSGSPPASSARVVSPTTDRSGAEPLGPVASSARAGVPSMPEASEPSNPAEPGSSARSTGFAPPSAVPGGLALQVSISAAEVNVGEVVTIDIVGTAGAELVDAPFHLLYDPRVLGYVDAFQGDLLGRDGSSVVFLANGTARPGDVAVGVGRSDRLRGIEGSGVIARIRLQATAPGMTSLRLDRALAWDSGAKRMSVTVQGASVRVR